MIDQTIIKTLVNVLGVDESEVIPEADFRLDLNATGEELMEIKHQLEDELEISLPIDSSETFPTTVVELTEIVHDACL
jgi:acyl carrier protein